MSSQVSSGGSRSSSWEYAFFGLLIGLASTYVGVLILTDQYWPAKGSVQYDKTLIGVNWWNALRGRPQQTRLTKRQKHVYGYVAILGGLLVIYGGLRLALPF